MKLKLFTIAFLMLIGFSCSENDIIEPQEENFELKRKSTLEAGDGNFIDNFNAQLASLGANVRIQKAEMLKDDGAAEVGTTIFANDNTLRLTSQWAPEDPRRAAQGKDITYMVDKSGASLNAPISRLGVDIEEPNRASFTTWENESCSNFNLVEREYAGVNPNYVLALFTGGAFPFGDLFQADIVNSGYLPGFVFEGLLGSSNILGVCFTLIFVDPATGEPTDINKDKFPDVALKEVWYNDEYPWSTDGSTVYDIETVALHENGHALGHAHNGKIFRTEANGKIKIASQAVMTAIYAGIQRTLLGTDKATHCSIYSDKGWRN